MLHEGSPLTLAFNLRGGFADAANALLGSASAASTASNAGQVSLFGLKPVTLEQKFQQLKAMIRRGQIALAAGVSLETVKYEMSKPENDGLSAKDMASRLAMKKMLKFTLAPGASLKVPQPGLRMAFA